jgi:hypothetical protein
MLYVVPVSEADVASIIAWHSSAIDDDSEEDLVELGLAQSMKEKPWVVNGRHHGLTYKTENSYNLD